MPAQGYDVFAPIRITKVVQMIRDRRDQTMPPLEFTRRLPRVPAENGELLGRFYGNVYIAPLIALDAQAPVYSSGEFRFEATKMPKCKIGRSLTETQMEKFVQITGGGQPTTEDQVAFYGPTAEMALRGIEHRTEALTIAMMLDQFNYDNLGYKASGITWGMPSDLKFTPSTPWTDAVNATPVDDILNAKMYARERYGRTYNRLTMSTQAYRYMIATAEFQTKTKVYLPPQITWANLSQNRLSDIMGMAERALDVDTIVLNDTRYSYQTPSGSDGHARFMPINKVIIDDTRNDGDPATWDLASGYVMESVLTGMPGSSVVGGRSSGLRNPTRGPLAYMTVSPNLDPPSVTFWAVDMVWPRKNDLMANAVMTIGDFADSIPVADPTF